MGEYLSFYGLRTDESAANEKAKFSRKKDCPVRIFASGERGPVTAVNKRSISLISASPSLTNGQQNFLTSYNKSSQYKQYALC